MSKKKVLIIEDEKFLSDLYKTKLEREGFLVQTAFDGEAGLKLALAEKADLILLDLVMPSMDGFQVLTEIKKDSEAKEIPVVVFSNLGDESKKNEAIKLGAVGFIVKADITPKELVSYINEKIN